jgi:hypothetical protein
VDKFKKYWYFFVIILLICSNAVTILWGIRGINANTEATSANTKSNTAVVTSIATIQKWMEGHDTRHEDHKELHEAERQ